MLISLLYFKDEVFGGVCNSLVSPLKECCYPFQSLPNFPVFFLYLRASVLKAVKCLSEIQVYNNNFNFLVQCKRPSIKSLSNCIIVGLFEKKPLFVIIQYIIIHKEIRYPLFVTLPGSEAGLNWL